MNTLQIRAQKAKHQIRTTIIRLFYHVCMIRNLFDEAIGCPVIIKIDEGFKKIKD